MRPEFQSGYTIETQRGDAFGEGGGVTHSIIMRTAHDAICLRMRYDSSLDRFHIVGYCAIPPKRAAKAVHAETPTHALHQRGSAHPDQ